MIVTAIIPIRSFSFISDIFFFVLGLNAITQSTIIRFKITQKITWFSEVIYYLSFHCVLDYLEISLLDFFARTFYEKEVLVLLELVEYVVYESLVFQNWKLRYQFLRFFGIEKYVMFVCLDFWEIGDYDYCFTNIQRVFYYHFLVFFGYIANANSRERISYFFLRIVLYYDFYAGFVYEQFFCKYSNRTEITDILYQIGKFLLRQHKHDF